MDEHTINTSFFGENLNIPLFKQLLPQLNIEVQVETGQIAPRGRHKGVPSPFGVVTYQIKLSQPELATASLAALMMNLMNHIDLLRQTGVETIEIDHWPYRNYSIQINIDPAP